MKRRILALMLALTLLLTTLLPGPLALAEEPFVAQAIEENSAEAAPDAEQPGDEPAPEAELPADPQPEVLEEAPAEDAPSDELAEVPEEELPGEKPNPPAEPEISEDSEVPEEPEISEAPEAPEAPSGMPEGEAAEKVEEIEGEASAEASQGIAETGGAATKKVIGGTCGSGVIWRIEGSKLIISGKGKMSNYDQSTVAPWLDFADQIDMLVVKRGVTKLGNDAFMEMTALRTIKLAEGVTDIGSSAFAFCDSLETLYIPKSLKYVHRYAFRFCGKLTLYYGGDEEQFNGILFDNDDDWERNPFIHASIWYSGIDWTPGNDPDFEDEKPLVEMHRGALQAVNVKKKTIEISGVQYSVKQSVANSMRTLLKNKNIQDKTVIYKLKNFALDSVYSIYDVVKIAVQDRKSVTDLYYWDGLYEKTRLEKVTLTLKMVAANPKKYYTEQELKEAGASLIINRAELKASAPFLFEETTQESGKKNVEKTTIVIPATTLGFEPRNSSYRLDIGPLIVNMKKKPKKGDTNVSMTLTPHYTSNENFLQKHRCTFTVNIDNLDIKSPGKAPDIEAEELADGMYTGILQGANTKKRIIMIDERRFSVEKPFASSMKDLLDNKNIPDKTVVYKIASGNLESVYSLYDVVKVVVKERKEENADLKYENEEYDKTRLEKVHLTLEIDVMDGAGHPYTMQELQRAQVSLRVDKLELQTDSKPYFFFEETKNYSTKNVKKLTADISDFTFGKKELVFSINYMGTNMSHELDIGPLVVNTKYAPEKKDVDAVLSLTPHYVGTSKTLKKHLSEFKLHIENPDIKNAEEKVESERTSLQSKLETSMSANTQIILGEELHQYLMNNYESAVATDMINTIKQYLTLYITEVPLMNQAESIPSTWVEKMQAYLKKSTTKALKSLKKKIVNKALSKMGLSSKALLKLPQKKTLKTSVKIEKTYVDFEIYLTEYFGTTETPFASNAQIDFSVRGTRYKGTGMFTFRDMEVFANTMLDFLKIAYDTSWGTKADKIANELIAHPYNKLLFGKGTFSGKIFNLAVDAAKNSGK